MTNSTITKNHINLSTQKALSNITEQGSKEGGLRENEEICRFLVENALDAIYLSRGRHFEYVNPRFCEMTGYSSEELTSPGFDFDMILGKESRRLIQQRHEAIKNGESIPSRYYLQILNKAGKPVEIEESTISVGSGGEVAFLGVMWDITERKRLEEELLERGEKYLALIEHSNDMVWTLDEKGNFLYFNKKSEEVTGHRFKDWTGKSFVPLILDEDLKMVEKVFMETMQGTPRHYEVRIHDCTKNKILTLSVNTAPMFKDGKVIGTVSFGRDITESKKAEEALKESENNLNSILSAMVDTVFRFDSEANFTFYHCPPSMQLIAPPEKFIGRKPCEVMPPHINERFVEAFEKNRKGELAEYEYWLLIFGEMMWFSVIQSPIIIDDKFTGAVAVVRDITKRKKAEKQVELLSSAVMQSAEGIAFSDLEGNILCLNNAFASIHGYTPEEIIGKNLSIFHTSEQIAAVREANRQIQQTGEFSGEIWHARRDATVFPALMHNSLLRDESGNPIGMIATLQDITDLKKAEEALKESERRYRTLLENVTDAIFIHDLNGKIIETNKETGSWTGYSQEELRDMRIMDLFPEKSGHKIIEAIGAVQNDGSHNFRDLFMKKDGSLVEVEVQTRLMEYGGVKVIHSIVRDITAGKKMENQILGYVNNLQNILNNHFKHSTELEKMIKERTKEMELEKEKYNSLFKDSNDAIFLIDPETCNIMDCNDKARSLVGCNNKECCGKKYYEVFLNEDKNMILKSIKKAYKNKNVNFRSIVLPEECDKSLFFETNLTLVEHGKRKLIQAISRDINQLIKIEEEVMKKTLRYEVSTGHIYLIEEPVLDRSLDIFNNLLECGFHGHIFSRTQPEVIKKNVDGDVDIVWLSEKKNNVRMKVIESKIENLSRGNNVILLDRLDYLLLKNEFKDILGFLHRLVEVIYIQKWILLISIDARTIDKKELLFLKKETLGVESKKKIELEENIDSLLKYINKRNNSGKMPSLTEIASRFKISRQTARKRVNFLEYLGLIKIIKRGRLKLLEITDKGKESL